MVDWKSRIVSLPEICHGKPCLRGTRVLVDSVLGSLAAGFTWEEVLAQYPGLCGEDLDAALAFAAERRAHRKLEE